MDIGDKLKYGRYTVETWPVGRNIGELILVETVYLYSDWIEIWLKNGPRPK
jgi:hypothetical protein